MTEEVQSFIKRAEHALEVAEKLIQDGYRTDASSKIYYAMFYAAQALLKSEGINVIRHSAVGSCFGHHFAKPKRIDPQYHNMLIEAKQIREIADYDIHEEIIIPDVSIPLENGKDFVNMAKSFLKL